MSARGPYFAMRFFADSRVLLQIEEGIEKQPRHRNCEDTENKIRKGGANVMEIDDLREAFSRAVSSFKIFHEESRWKFYQVGSRSSITHQPPENVIKIAGAIRFQNVV